jgi:hypothetical protein
MKLRVYLDTTVLSAAEDARTPDRRDRTIEFFNRSAEFDLTTSELTRSEIAATPDITRKDQLLRRLNAISIIAITSQMHSLASEYVKNDIIPAAYEDDALHIAAAVLSAQEVLLSWNFRHMVNRRRRALVNQLNALQGLPAIEILTPPEL